MQSVKLIECPRDAWQGLPGIIDTADKVRYLRALLDAGFRHIDAVSFVSPRHVPQMADSEAVMAALTEQGALAAAPEIIAIVVNDKGLKRALNVPGVTTIGFPCSISEQFTRNNANMSGAEARALVRTIRTETHKAGRALVVYVSMGFGNPYGEPWSNGLVVDTIRWLKSIGVGTVSLADTVGKATAAQVSELFRAVTAGLNDVEVGVHLHSRRENAAEQVLAAYDAGCRRFDSALAGLGGCPFAGDALVGNTPTEILVDALASRGADAGVKSAALASLISLTEQLTTNKHR